MRGQSFKPSHEDAEALKSSGRLAIATLAEGTPFSVAGRIEGAEPRFLQLLKKGTAEAADLTA